MVKVRCRVCGKEVEGHSHQTRCCGCSNMTTVTGDSITALDMSKVMIVSYGHYRKQKGWSHFTRFGVARAKKEKKS